MHSYISIPQTGISLLTLCLSMTLELRKYVTTKDWQFGRIGDDPSFKDRQRVISVEPIPVIRRQSLQGADSHKSHVFPQQVILAHVILWLAFCYTEKSASICSKHAASLRYFPYLLTLKKRNGP